MIEFERSKKPVKPIGLIPMINVIFLLLIYFLVIGSIEKLEIIPIDVPVAENGKVVDEGQLTIVLGKHDEILANDEFLSDTKELKSFVKEQLKGKPDLFITLKADAKARSGQVIDVMKILEEAGGQHLALATQSP
jgi:biopolymer transport protein ExbD